MHAEPVSHRLNVALRPGSPTMHAYASRAGVSSDAIASGFHPRPDLDLTYHGGRTITDLVFVNRYLGGPAAWDDADRTNIDSALHTVLTDPGMQGIIAQYFSAPISTTMLPSQYVHQPIGDRFFKDQAEVLVTNQVAAGALGDADPANTVLCLMLPPGVVLVDGNSDGSDVEDPRARAVLVDDDQADSTHGLGGYHGSVHIGDQTCYYAIGVYSDGDNGIVAFDEPWKNVVATSYHLVNEARTDPDIEDAIRTGNEELLGWYSRKGGEIGDIPLMLATDLSLIMPELRLRGGHTVPAQLLWSNKIHGLEYASDAEWAARPDTHPRDREPAREPSRWVGTGLSTPDAPLVSMTQDRCATPDTDYLYWFQVGDSPPEEAVDLHPERLRLTPDAGPGTILTVALFSFPNEIEIVRGVDVGQLILRADGEVVVHRQPGLVTGEVHRLFFPIRTPAQPGRHRLRCNLYGRQTLLQSRLLQIEVAPGAPALPGAIHSTTDYVIDPTLNPAELAEIEPPTLSVFMNDNGDGTHGFRFFGDNGDIKADTVLREGELQNHIERARKALAQVTWGSEDMWRPGTSFRYVHQPENSFPDDLVTLAITGYRIWAKIAGQVAAEGRPASDDTTAPITALQERMRKAGMVEFVSKYGAAQVVPASLFYDYPLDTGLTLTVCREALQAIDCGSDLASQPCFQGWCPAYNDYSVVCPGGFWGFRHRIGLPQSVRVATATEPPAEHANSGIKPIEFRGRPRCMVGIAAEFAGPHPTFVRGLGDKGSRCLKHGKEAGWAPPSGTPDAVRTNKTSPRNASSSPCSACPPSASTSMRA